MVNHLSNFGTKGAIRSHSGFGPRESKSRVVKQNDSTVVYVQENVSKQPLFVGGQQASLRDSSGRGFDECGASRDTPPWVAGGLPGRGVGALFRS